MNISAYYLVVYPYWIFSVFSIDKMQKQMESPKLTNKYSMWYANYNQNMVLDYLEMKCKAKAKLLDCESIICSFWDYGIIRLTKKCK